MTFTRALLIEALVCFILAFLVGVGVTILWAAVAWIAAGLACWVGAEVLR